MSNADPSEQEQAVIAEIEEAIYRAVMDHATKNTKKKGLSPKLKARIANTLHAHVKKFFPPYQDENGFTVMPGGKYKITYNFWNNPVIDVLFDDHRIEIILDINLP